MLTLFRQRRGEQDRGDAILVMGVIFIGLFTIVASFALGITEISFQSSSYQTMVQTSVDDSVRCINQNGGLTGPGDPANTGACGASSSNTGDSVDQAIDSYNEQFYGNGGTGVDSDTRTRGCSYVIVNGVQHTAPYIQVTLAGNFRDDTDVTPEAPVTWTSEGTGDNSTATSESVTPPTLTSGSYVTNSNYQTITMTVYEVSSTIGFTNPLSVFRADGGSAGGTPIEEPGCHQFIVTKTGVTFDSQSDTGSY